MHPLNEDELNYIKLVLEAVQHNTFFLTNTCNRNDKSTRLELNLIRITTDCSQTAL